MDLTGKQKRYLRAQAVTIKPVVQIGKAGLTNEILDSVRAAVDSRELIKIQILQNSDATTAEVAEMCERMGFDVVQIIGRHIIIFKVASLFKNRKLSTAVKEL
ncbi:MAG: YhbY family RNA-binding protein [Streptococcaceae bacterium]|jgi:RNA-binding protein|nr:YhbY family RNA-binding protein [Streptococcaceae bacterium]